MTELQEIRKKTIYTQKKIAEKCGIGRRSYQDYERGVQPIEKASYHSNKVMQNIKMQT